MIIKYTFTFIIILSLATGVSYNACGECSSGLFALRPKASVLEESVLLDNLGYGYQPGKGTERPESFALFISPVLSTYLQRWGDFSHTINTAFILRELYPDSAITIFLDGPHTIFHSEIFENYPDMEDELEKSNIIIKKWSKKYSETAYDVVLTYSMTEPDNVKYKMHIDLEDFDGTTSNTHSRKTLYKQQTGENTYGIKLGFGKNTLGIILDPVALRLKKWFDSLSKSERLSQRIKVIDELSSRFDFSAVLKQSLHAGIYGICYMALDTDMYLTALSKVIAENPDYYKRPPVIFTIIGKEDSNERKLIGETAESLGFGFIDFADTAVSFDGDIINKGKNAVVVNMPYLPKPLFQRLLLFSDLPVGVTGSSSICEAIILDKVWIYETRPWLTGIASSLGTMAFDLLRHADGSHVDIVLKGKNIITSSKNTQRVYDLSLDDDELNAHTDNLDTKPAAVSDIFLHVDKLQDIFHIINRYSVSVLDFKRNFKKAIEGLWVITVQARSYSVPAISARHKATALIKESA
jgi:hypothetical protein